MLNRLMAQPRQVPISLPKLAQRHGTTTTTDWSLLTQDEAVEAVENGQILNEGEMAYLFDSDNTGSV